ncbi:MAG TPA: phosphoenolpyruvate carboxykinase, partial [Verrucomicrobiales bacterium]|nr:phosphoenolpyruvate carboxykinase [Verrucomicrobiales bacterium]
TVLGWVPGAHSFDLDGLEGVSKEDMRRLQSIDHDEWRREVLSQDELFMKLYSHLPKELVFQRELLVARL